MKLPSEGHDLVKSERKEAGCTADGHEEYWQCSKCHRFFSDEEGNTRISEPKVISKTGHSLKKVEKKEASCTESGYEAYWKCQNETCQRLFSDEGGKTGINQPKEIKATGHKYEEPAYIWSADNLKCNAERKCTACDDVEMETASTTSQVVQEKNCTLPELTTYSATFKNDAFKPQTKENVQTVAAIGHDLEKVAKKEANCTENGYETYWKCKTCKKLFSDKAGTKEINKPKEIKATGHDLEKVAKKEANCTEAGYEAYWKCKTCGKLFSDKAGTEEISKPEKIKATGHNLEKVAQKEASCTEVGYKEYWKCKTCGKLFSDENGKTEIKESEEIKATGHSYGEATYKWSVDNQKCTAERKCTACGNVESETADATAKVVQEKNCTLPELTTYSATFKNDTFKPQTKENVQTADAIGHNLEKVAKKEASCTEVGYKEYWKCKTCGKLFSDEPGKTEIKESEEIKATGHSYGEAAYKWSADNQKCTAERKCTACGNVESETADATVTVVQEKNCILPELTMFHVIFKNDVFEGQTKENVKTADAIGHDLEKVAKKEASCTEAGYEAYWKCQTCKKLFSDETGKTEISESIEIPALGHSLEKIEKKEAGCTESGYEAYWKCQICEKLFSDEAGTDEIVSLDDIQIPAKGHEEGNEWLSDAEKHWKECAVCQEKTEEADHVYVNETDTVCEICGYERTIKSEVPEILEGHNGKWQMNSGKTLSFRSSAPFAEFISVTIDDVVVDEKNYDKAEGSTIITLHSEFLSTLSVGTHTLSIDSASGSAVTEFTIEEATAEPSITETPSVTEAPSPTTAPSATTASTAATVTPTPTASPETKAPKTGDESNVAIWMLLLFFSAEGIIVALQKSKKKTR